MTADPDARTVKLPQGTIRYREAGTGEPIVFVHGLLVNGLLWHKVVAELQADFRCITPDFPLGSHEPPMEEGADLTPPGLAKLIADFMSALELERVTLVGNDTGGALSQIVATRHPERLGRLVLTNCDAFKNFLPPFFRPLQWIARVPGGLAAATQGLRVPRVRSTALGYGLLVKHPVDPQVLASWATPVTANRGTRRDLTKVLRGISPRYTLEAAERLKDFDRPTLIAWAPEDPFFKLDHARKLADAIPDATLETVEDSKAFVPMDQPKRLAELIRS